MENPAPVPNTESKDDDQPSFNFRHFEPGDPLIGQTIAAKFQIIELIGTGGWSRVYRARQSDSDTPLAIKVLHSHLLFDKESVSRFDREARSGVGLSHPNICRVLDYDRLPGGQPYIVMEYLKGESLSNRLKRKGKLEPGQAVPIVIACCRALQAAHAQGIIHRDIKPANIFLTDGDGEGREVVKLVDFGMAKLLIGSHPDLTQTGTAFGTVQYMSPEQALADKVDGRSDLYALGCVMYEMLTGKKVFEGGTAYSVMEQHVRSAPKKFSQVDSNLVVPKRLEEIVMQALAKLPDRRFQSAEQLAAELETALAEEPRSSMLTRQAIIIAVAVVAAIAGSMLLAGH